VFSVETNSFKPGEASSHHIL